LKQKQLAANYERKKLFLMLLILNPFNWGIDSETSDHGDDVAG
jgi:hypothetical protein